MTPAFEQFARSKGWSLLHKGETGEYRALNTQAGWLAWQAREVPQWLPIESAPKDGRTNIMLTNGKDVSQGWWCHDEGGITEHRDTDGRYIDQDEREGYIGWLDFDGGMLPEPTHWMPLPAAPQQPASLGGGGVK